jgi:uncharacterized membrane protein
MPGLTTLGIIHTAISLIALAAGIIALARDKEISSANFVGKLYIWTTVIVCLTGFPIMQHGGFGKPHALGILTLAVLVIAAMGGRSKFGKASRYVQAVSYTATFFFHLIPTFVETTTRLPVGAPLVADRDGPVVQAATGVIFLLFLIGATLQVLRIRVKFGLVRASLSPVATRPTH